MNFELEFVADKPHLRMFNELSEIFQLRSYSNFSLASCVYSLQNSRVNVRVFGNKQDRQQQKKMLTSG